MANWLHDLFIADATYGQQFTLYAITFVFIFVLFEALALVFYPCIKNKPWMEERNKREWKQYEKTFEEFGSTMTEELYVEHRQKQWICWLMMIV
jgi:hypothetical protein